MGAALCLIGLWSAPDVQASVLRHEHNINGRGELERNTYTTAGIGSGAPLASFLTEAADSDDWYCARYDTSYPEIIYSYLGSSVDDFQSRGLQW